LVYERKLVLHKAGSSDVEVIESSPTIPTPILSGPSMLPAFAQSTQPQVSDPLMTVVDYDASHVWLGSHIRKPRSSAKQIQYLARLDLAL
jgi:hypothetical protein